MTFMRFMLVSGLCNAFSIRSRFIRQRRMDCLLSVVTCHSADVSKFRNLNVLFTGILTYNGQQS